MSFQPKILYLDQNAWIALARGAWDKAAYPAEHAALTVVVEAAMAGHIVVPLSLTNQYETMKVDQPNRRAHLAHVQVTISRGKVLRARRGILEVMLSQRIAEEAKNPIPPLSSDWFLSDIWIEAAAEHSSGVFDEFVSPAVLDYMRQNPQETLFQFLIGDNEVTRKSAIQQYTAGSRTLLERLEARRQHLEGETFALRLRAYAAILMLEEIDHILAMGRQQGLAWFNVKDIGDKIGKNLVASVPVMNIECQLAVRLEDQKRSTTENDLRDMAAFTCALSLVDIIVAEKQFVNLSRQSKLDTKYGTALLTSVHDLTPQMLTPTSDSQHL